MYFLDLDYNKYLEIISKSEPPPPPSPKTKPNQQSMHAGACYRVSSALGEKKKKKKKAVVLHSKSTLKLFFGLNLIS